MKRFLLFFSLSIVTIAARAQFEQANDCGFIIPPPSLRSNFASVYEAGSYVRSMLGKINWQENFQLREQNGMNNAYATIIRNQRYIVYDNRFLESLDRYAGTKWASISVLAHEMGHHYRNHVLSGEGSTPAKELEADFFSGYMMAKMGARLEEAKAAMSQIASPGASATHPGKADRLVAIENGWNNANGSISQTPATPEPQRKPAATPQRRRTTLPKQNTPSTKDASWIHLSVYGNSDMTVYLSDNGRDFSPASLKTNKPFVFKYEVYDYGWLRLGNGSNSRIFKLYHGKDYAIVRTRDNGWSVMEVPR